MKNDNGVRGRYNSRNNTERMNNNGRRRERKMDNRGAGTKQ